jgi:hypothetical protein
VWAGLGLGLLRGLVPVQQGEQRIRIDPEIEGDQNHDDPTDPTADADRKATAAATVAATAALILDILAFPITQPAHR